MFSCLDHVGDDALDGRRRHYRGKKNEHDRCELGRKHGLAPVVMPAATERLVASSIRMKFRWRGCLRSGQTPGRPMKYAGLAQRERQETGKTCARPPLRLANCPAKARILGVASARKDAPSGSLIDGQSRGKGSDLCEVVEIGYNALLCGNSSVGRAQPCQG